MSGAPAERRAGSMQRISRIIGMAVAFEGALVLAGWALEIDAFKSVVPGFATMKPMTALCFLLIGLALRAEALPLQGRVVRRSVMIVALAAALVSLLTLVEHYRGIGFGVDTLLFREPVLAEGVAEPGRMAPPTAASILLLAVGISLARWEGFWTRVTETLALLVAIVALVALTGYFYGVRSLYAVSGYSSMALHTALTLLLLALGLLAYHPERGLAAIVIGDGPGARAARRLLPAVVVFPLLLGWLRLAGEQAGLYQTAFGTSLLVLILVTVFSAVVLWNARSLDRVEGERRLADEAMREKSRFLQLILDGMSDGVIVADAQGQFLLFNRAAEKLLGMSGAGAVPGRWAEHFGIFRDDGTTPYPSAELPLARAIRGEEATGVELVSRHAGRPEGVWLRVSARPLQDPQGLLEGGIAMFSDSTERRRLDEARLHALEIQEVSRRVEETSRLKSEFLANMSHELRTPLNAIIGFSELMHDGKVGPLESQQQEFVSDILSSSRHLLQLINDVLDLSKIEAGKMEFRPESLVPAKVATEIRDALRNLAVAKRITVTVDAAGGPAEVVVDAAKLKQVVYNYLSNALKFTPEGGRVTIRLAAEGAGDFRLEVEDNGIGIRPEDMGRLFVQFQQLDATTTKKYAGTGLGLALTKRIVEAQGGTVGARSRAGEGSVFFAILPRAAQPLAPATRALGADGKEEAAWRASRS